MAMQTTEQQQQPVTLELAIEAIRRVLPPRRRDTVALTPEVRFEDDLGLSSLDVGEVFVRLEELVGKPLDTSRIEGARTIGDLLRLEVVEDRAW
jgi:acyl carrier protein